MNWLRDLLGIPSDEEVVRKVNGELPVRKARRALQRARVELGDADAFLIEAEEAEADRLAAASRT